MGLARRPGTTPRPTDFFSVGGASDVFLPLLALAKVPPPRGVVAARGLLFLRKRFTFPVRLYFFVKSSAYLYKVSHFEVVSEERSPLQPQQVDKGPDKLCLALEEEWVVQCGRAGKYRSRYRGS